MPSDPRARFAITADNTDYRRKLKAALRDTNRFSGSVAQALRVGARAGAAGLAVTAIGLTRVANEAAKSADALAKQADILGITTQKLAAYQLAARLSGSTNEGFEKGLRKLQKAIVDAQNGLTTYTRAFDALGLDPNELARLTPDKQFDALAKSFARVESQTQRVAIAYDLFGGRNTALLNTLVLTGSQLGQLEEDTKAWGVAISRVDARQLEQANDAVERAQTALTGIGTNIALALAPLRGGFADAFSESAAASEGFKTEIQATMEAVVVASNFAANSVRGIQLAFTGAQLTLNELRQSIPDLQEILKNVPAFGIGMAARGLEALGVGGDEGSPRQLTEEADRLGAKIDEIIGKFQSGGQALARFRALQAEALAAANESLQVTGEVGGLAGSLLGLNSPEENEETQKRLQEAKELLLGATDDLLSEVTRREKAAADERVRINQAAEAAIRQQKQQTANLSVGLLQALGSENRAFQIAAIAVEKAIAIQRLLQQNRVAAELAFASQLIPGDPTSLGRAQAAKAAVLTQGKAGAALLAATGAVQIASLGSGSTGAPLGTPTNPVFTNSADGRSAGLPGQGDRRLVVEVRGAGVLAGAELAKLLKEATGADEIFIAPGSRQYQVLQG